MKLLIMLLLCLLNMQVLQAQTTKTSTSELSPFEKIQVKVKNPMINKGFIDLKLGEDCNVRVTVVDGQKRLIKLVLVKDFKAGTYNLPIDVSDIPEGDYKLKIDIPNSYLMKRLEIKHDASQIVKKETTPPSSTIVKKDEGTITNNKKILPPIGGGSMTDDNESGNNNKGEKKAILVAKGTKEEAKETKLAAKEEAKQVKEEAKETKLAAKEEAKQVKEETKETKLAAKEKAKEEAKQVKEEAKETKLAAKEKAKEEAKQVKEEAKEEEKPPTFVTKESPASLTNNKQSNTQTSKLPEKIGPFVVPEQSVTNTNTQTPTLKTTSTDTIVREYISQYTGHVKEPQGVNNKIQVSNTITEDNSFRLPPDTKTTNSANQLPAKTLIEDDSFRLPSDTKTTNSTLKLTPTTMMIDDAVQQKTEVKTTSDYKTLMDGKRYIHNYGIDVPDKPKALIPFEQTGKTKPDVKVQFVNPVRTGNIIRLTLSERCKITMRIKDNNSNVLKELMAWELDEGIHDIPVGLNDIAVGYYLLEVKTIASTETLPFNVIR